MMRTKFVLLRYLAPTSAVDTGPVNLLHLPTHGESGAFHVAGEDCVSTLALSVCQERIAINPITHMHLRMPRCLRTTPPRTQSRAVKEPERRAFERCMRLLVLVQACTNLYELRDYRFIHSGCLVFRLTAIADCSVTERRLCTALIGVAIVNEGSCVGRTIATHCSVVPRVGRLASPPAVLP